MASLPRRSPADRLLSHLQLSRESPTLDYLHRIIRAHQLCVPFETLTKLIDYEPGRRRGDFLPEMSTYVDRIVSARRMSVLGGSHSTTTRRHWAHPLTVSSRA